MHVKFVHFVENTQVIQKLEAAEHTPVFIYDYCSVFFSTVSCASLLVLLTCYLLFGYFLCARSVRKDTNEWSFPFLFVIRVNAPPRTPLGPFEGSLSSYLSAGMGSFILCVFVFQMGGWTLDGRLRVQCLGIFAFRKLT